jgi:predicted oxidoreductase
MQIELLKKYLNQKIIINQLQFSIPASNLISVGLEANMDTPGAADRDGSALDYCRLNDIMIQAWSPFQKPAWKGPFIGDEEYQELTTVLDELAQKYEVSPTSIASAWILRHPAGMQIISGTTNEERLRDIVEGSKISLTREEWYRLYLEAGNILP